MSYGFDGLNFRYQITSKIFNQASNYSLAIFLFPTHTMFVDFRLPEKHDQKCICD